MIHIEVICSVCNDVMDGEAMDTYSEAFSHLRNVREVGMDSFGAPLCEDCQDERSKKMAREDEEQYLIAKGLK